MNLKYTALIIDDSKPISFFNKVLLERSNLFSEVKISENGQNAITLLNTGFSPDIIFLDLNMPVMNGWEFLEEYTQKYDTFSSVFLLLGVTLNDKDMSRLDKYTFVKGVREKMLNDKVIDNIKNSILTA